MKRVIVAVVLVAMLLMSFCSCAVTEEATQDQGKGNATPNNSSALGDYEVVIEGCRLADDYAGDPVVIVKYKFTNNSDEAEAFSWAVKCSVYQDGIGLNESYVLDDSANYSPDNQLKEIKPGATLEVEVAYKLNDTTTDVEVEVSELISWSDKKITKTFAIK